MFADLYGKTTFNFVENKQLYYFTFSPARNENYCCSPSLPEFAFVNVLNFSHSNRYVMVSCYCFNLQFSDLWCSTSFICLFVIYVSSLMKCLFKPFVHFLIELVCLLLSFKSSLHILDTSHLSDIFSPTVACLFILSTVSCNEQKFSILTKPNFTHFFLARITLLMYFKTQCQIQDSCINFLLYVLQ